MWLAMRIHNARILVTGASSGIGAAVAVQLAARGARLILTARREDRLRRVAIDIVRRYPQAAFPRVVAGDVTDPLLARRLVREAIALWGGLDALVNNAGISAYGETDQLPTVDLRQIMEVNFFAPVRTTFEVLPHFQEQGRGTVVNVASLAALFGVPFLGAYGASKAALVNFSQSLRAENQSRGVRVTVVYPNYTDTDLFHEETTTGTARRPSHAYGSADQVAAAIVRAMEHDRDEVVLTLSGKAMRTASGLAPSLLGRFMAGMASRLGGDPGPVARREAS